MAYLFQQICKLLAIGLDRLEEYLVFLGKRHF